MIHSMKIGMEWGRSEDEDVDKEPRRARMMTKLRMKLKSRTRKSLMTRNEDEEMDEAY